MSEEERNTAARISRDTKQSVIKFVLDALLVVTAFAWTDAIRSLWTGPKAPFKFLADRGPWAMAIALTFISILAMQKLNSGS